MDYKTALGLAGEKIAKEFFIKEGKKVEDSIDPFDNKKDMIVDGKHTEVKTQTPWVLQKSFTIKNNHQFNKCKNADMLIFVQAPCTKLPSCAIYQVMKGFSYTTRTAKKNGYNMVLIPMNQEKVKKLVEYKEGSIQYNTLLKYRTDF